MAITKKGQSGFGEKIARELYVPYQSYSHIRNYDKVKADMDNN